MPPSAVARSVSFCATALEAAFWGKGMYRSGMLAAVLLLGLLGAAGCGPLACLPNNPPDAACAHASRPDPLLPAGCGDDDGEPCPQNIATVSTVMNPEARLREISLAECIALALENGRTGQFFDRAGTGRRTSVTGVAPGGASGVSDSIRVLAYTPAILGTDIEQSLSRFDVIWQTGFQFNHFDEPVGLTSLLPEGVPGFNNSTVQNVANSFAFFNTTSVEDTALFGTQLIKPLPTGGTAGISFLTDYFNTPNIAGALNVPVVDRSIPINNPFLFTPAYRPQVNFTFEQPLLQGFGLFTNDVRDSHPGSLRTPFPTDVRAPGILLTRVTYEQSKLEFQRQVHDLLYTVEEAYWELYGAYWDLHSREVGMRQALSAWQVAKQKFDKGGLPARNLAQIEQQYLNFRIQRLQALGHGAPGQSGVLEAERRLRYVLGLPAEDGTRLIPCNMPVDTPQVPDWKSAVADAFGQRPELQQIHQELRAAELILRRSEDLRLPDLRFLARYNINGLGQDLGSALDNFAQARYDDWDAGLVLSVPLGARLGNSEVARAKLKLAQRNLYLRDQEDKVVLSLQRSYRDVVQLSEEIHLRRLRQNAASAELTERFKIFQAGASDEASLNVLLEAQRNWIEALRDEQLAICRYNVALADFEWQKGTIMAYDNVQVAEGAVPAYAFDRASKHIRQFQRSLTLWHNRRGDVQVDGVSGSPAAPVCGPPVPWPAAARLPDSDRKQAPGTVAKAPVASATVAPQAVPLSTPPAPPLPLVPLAPLTPPTGRAVMLPPVATNDGIGSDALNPASQPHPQASPR